MELAAFVLALGIGCVPLFRAGAGGLWMVLWVCTFAIAGLAGRMLSQTPAESPAVAPPIPREARYGGYVSSTTCRRCHPGQHASWHSTFHRTMTQRATPETVLAPIDELTLRSRSRSYHLTRSEGKFFVRMIDPNWEQEAMRRGVDVLKVPNPPMIKREIVLTTGSHHYQAYWIPGRFGRELRQVPFVYHLQEKRWIPREDLFLGPPVEQRQFGIWNINCIQCHTVAGQPGHDKETNDLWSRVVEFGIACESCHGPGGEHVQRHRNPLQRYSGHLRASGDSTIVNPARLNHRASSELCGQCHAAFYPKDEDDWWDHGYSRSYQAGGSLSASRHLLEYTQNPQEEWLVRWMRDVPGGIESKFWPDGTCRVGGREFLSMRESGCFTAGRMSCLSCHSMHGYEDRADQLGKRMSGNRACTQCHTQPQFTTRVESHTHHPAGSAGSRCYNCHMPHTSYALFKAIRSHRVDSPEVVTQPANSKPNACNLCHLDRTQQWAADALTEWYGQKRVVVDSDEREVAAGVLWALKGNAAQRALVAWHYGWGPAQQASGTEWMPPFLAQLLADPYSVVRFIAGRELKSLPGYSELTYDFLKPPAQRHMVKERVLRMWRNRSPANSSRRSSEVLIQPDGSLSKQRLDRLLKQRDNSPIHISE